MSKTIKLICPVCGDVQYTFDPYETPICIKCGVPYEIKVLDDDTD